jgi:hypothetical protein
MKMLALFLSHVFLLWCRQLTHQCGQIPPKKFQNLQSKFLSHVIETFVPEQNVPLDSSIPKWNENSRCPEEGEGVHTLSIAMYLRHWPTLIQMTLL